MDSTIYKTLILNRKSVYPKFFDPSKKISDEVIREILEHAVWAPTHGLTQPWFFKVFHGQGVETFFQAMKSIYEKITPDEKINPKKLEKYQQKALQVSHIIAVCMHSGSNPNIPKIEEIVATGCVIQNIYLSLEPYQIAGYLSTGDICYTPEMKTFLELTEQEECLGFFQLGIPAEDAPEKKRKRIPAEQKTTWINT